MFWLHSFSTYRNNHKWAGKDSNKFWMWVISYVRYFLLQTGLLYWCVVMCFRGCHSKTHRKATWHSSSLSNICPKNRKLGIKSHNFCSVCYKKVLDLWLWCLMLWWLVWYCYQRLTAEVEIIILLATATDFSCGWWKCPFYPENFCNDFRQVLVLL